MRGMYEWDMPRRERRSRKNTVQECERDETGVDEKAKRRVEGGYHDSKPYSTATRQGSEGSKSLACWRRD